MEVLSREMAIAEFERFAKFCRLKLDRKRSQAAADELSSAIDYFVEEVMDGRIVVDEEGKASVLTQNAETPKVSFLARPLGVVLKAMDQHKADENIAKLMAMIGAATKLPPAKLGALDYVDLRNVQAVFNFFLVQ